MIHIDLARPAFERAQKKSQFAQASASVGAITLASSVAILAKPQKPHSDKRLTGFRPDRCG